MRWQTELLKSRIKKKEWKELRTVSEAFGIILKAPTEEKMKESKKIFEKTIVENFPNMGKK